MFRLEPRVYTLGPGKSRAFIRSLAWPLEPDGLVVQPSRSEAVSTGARVRRATIQRHLERFGIARLVPVTLGRDVVAAIQTF